MRRLNLQSRVALFAIVLCSSAAIHVPVLLGEDVAPREYQIKAAMLINLMQFVEWPAESIGSAGDPVVLGVTGNDPFGETLVRMVADKTVAGHPVRVAYFANPDQIGRCHLLFIPQSDDDHLRTILEKVSGSAVLTVGETDEFSRNGGIIQFYLEDNKLRIAINPAAARRAALTISSKLMRLARTQRD